MREPHHPPRAELELSTVLHALSDPARLAVVRELGGCEECSCGDFEIGISKATLSHHFRVLREAGVVRTRLDGRHRYLSLRRDDLEDRFPGLLRAVLASDEGDRGHLSPRPDEATSARLPQRRPGTTGPLPQRLHEAARASLPQRPEEAAKASLQRGPEETAPL